MKISSERVVPMIFLVLLLLLVHLYYSEYFVNSNIFKSFETNEYDRHTSNYKTTSEQYDRDFDMTPTISNKPGKIFKVKVIDIVKV